MVKRAIPEQYLAIAAIYPKWQRAMATARRAIAEVETGTGSETGREDWKALQRVKDRLYKLVEEAAAHAPLSYKDPSITALYGEIKALPSMEETVNKGREARIKERDAEIKRLREEEREARRPYDWMRR